MAGGRRSSVSITKDNQENNNHEQILALADSGANRRSMLYRRVVYVDGIKAQGNLTANNTFKWEQLLEELKKEADNTNEEDRVLPVSLFGNAPLGHFLNVLHTGLKLEVRHHDYDSLFPDKQIYWIANVNKIVGYRMLMRFVGMDQDEDDKFDFWVNIGSEDVKHVGFCSANESCDLLPPNAIRTRQEDWSNYILCRMHNCKTLANTWVRERQLALIEGRFKIGTRLELLDRQVSSHIRPARVTQQLGRRICVRVCQEDVDENDLGDDQAQIKTGVWCDESWELIFPVGWALQNQWELVANQAYTQHCEQIVQAIGEGRSPVYEPFDASPEIFNDWKANQESNAVHWEVGMKFECIDPLNQSFLEMKVATCLGLLKDGYLKVGFDGPDMEDEAIPIHCTSPYLFPINYAQKYDITLAGPLEENMVNFKWDEYLSQCQATAAPSALFDNIPEPEKMSQFKIGAKLEATDQCESNLVCPSTVRAVRGRLLQIHFDGWGDDMDQLYDYRSRDLFPLGWCEMYGYKLEPPKSQEQPAKRKNKKK